MLAKISARLRKREGFTLIELLVVVAIIGLLATLAMPRVFESINKAKRAQGDADIHTMSTAVEQAFMESTNSQYPTGPFSTAAEQTATTTAIKDRIVNSGLLKAHAKNLTNPFSHGYIYVSNTNGEWYAVIDPADTTNGLGAVTLTCGTGNTVTLDVAATFTVKPDVAPATISKDDVKDNKCEATVTTGGKKLSVITN